MTKTIWKSWLAFGAIGAVVLSTAAAVNGQDNVLIPGGPIEYTLQPLADAAKSPPGAYFVLTDDDAKAGEAARAADAAKAALSGDNPSEYWIGIGLGELPDIAKQQLGVEDGLVVSEVMDDSPAAKAGFKKNDILVKAGDAPVKAPADLIKAVDASHGKQMIITIVRGGKDRTIEVTPAKRSEETSRREAVRVEHRGPNMEFREEIKRVEEALENLKNKAGKDGMSFWFARPGVVAPGITTQYYKIAPEFPKDLSVKIIKEGQEPTKIHVQRGDKEWNLTEDKQGVNLKELPEEIRAHVQRLLVGIPGKATMGTRVVRVTPEGKVEGELNITPAPPRPPLPPKPAVPPVAGQARTFTYRTERNESSSDSKLDALISEVKQLRKEIDELRSKK